MTWGGWNSTNEARLKLLAEKGYSSSQIARDIGAPSRNAVIGKVYRLGISLKGGGYESPEVIAARIEARRQAAVSREQRALARIARAERLAQEARDRAVRGDHVKLHTLEIAAPVVIECSPRLWTTRNFGECAFPMEGEGADIKSCCNPVSQGSWCAGHRRIATTPAKDFNPRNTRVRGETVAAKSEDETPELEFAA